MNHTKIGTYSWVVKANGQMSFKEKIKLFNTLLIPSLMTPIKENLYKKQLNKNINLDQIIVSRY